MSSIALSNIGGAPTQSASNLIVGRFYLNAGWSPVVGVNYLPATFAVASDVPNSQKAVVQATNSPNQITYNTSNSLFYIPVSGMWTFTFCSNHNAVSASYGHQLKIMVYSSPAWSSTGLTAVTYGTGGAQSNAANLFDIRAAQLIESAFVTNSDGVSCSVTVPLVAGTYIAPLVYASSTSMTFGAAGLYFHAILTQPLS